jgi:hypothetical protein
VLNSIEKFRKIHIHDEAVAFADCLLNLPGCSMSGTLWSKTVARFRKLRIEQRSQDLLDGLLN